MKSTFSFIALGSLALGVNAIVAPAGQPIQFQIIEPSLNVKAPCITATNNVDGAPVVIQTCNTDPAFRSWTVENGGVEQGTGPSGPIKIFGDKCLDVTNGVDVDGTELQVWTCTEGDTNQMWNVNSDLSIEWTGKNKCVDLTNGIQSDGNPIQIWDCVEGNTNQEWNPDPITPAGLLIVHEPASGSVQGCLASTNTDGAPVLIEPCNLNATNQMWNTPVLGQGGTITIFEDKCLDVTNGVDADGTKLQVFTCTEGDTNQIWHINTDSTIQWLNHAKCVDLTNGISTAGNQVQIWDCVGGNTNQIWELTSNPFNTTA